MIALCLQCCPIDVNAAMELARLICDIEPGPVSQGEFVLVYRKDTDHRIARFFEGMVRQKFPTARACVARNHDTGWAGGCNMLAYSSFMEISILRRQQVVKNDGFLLFEPDCVPLSSDWLSLLSAEWDRAKASGKECIGHWHQMGPADTLHMNGNAIYASAYYELHPQDILGPATQGWDYWHREKFIARGMDTNLIYQHYNRPTITQPELESITKNGVRPAFFHGVKDGSARAAVRAVFCQNALSA
jgi:hypothetical protein